MGKTKTRILYCIPFIMQVFIHMVASGGFAYSTPDNFLLRVLRAALVTGFSLLLGEGYGSIAFIVAGAFSIVLVLMS